MQGAGKFAVLLLLLFSTHPAAGEDEHKLGKMLHRQAQDIATLMTDGKTIIMRQDSQQQDIATLMTDGKTIIMRQDSQHQEEAEDLAQVMSDVKTIIMRQDSQQQYIATLMTDVKTQQQDLAQLMTDVKTIITFHEQHQLWQEKAERRWSRDSCTVSTGLTTLLVHDHLMSVPCDDGTVVILRRIDNEGNFAGRGWEDYKKGFGDSAGSYWLGLENMHHLTNGGSAKLRVELETWDGESAWAEYSSVRIHSESDGYRLEVGGYTGNAGDSLTYSNGMKFSTIDVDNDRNTGHCAEKYNAGWWYKGCFFALLTGPYIDHGELDTGWRGIQWQHFKGTKYSLKQAEMKLILD